MRIDAMYRLNPSRDSIGQPSLAALFTSTTGVATLHAHHSSCDAYAAPEASRKVSAAAALKRRGLVVFISSSLVVGPPLFGGPVGTPRRTAVTQPARPGTLLVQARNIIVKPVTAIQFL